MMANIMSKDLFQRREWSALLVVAAQGWYDALTNLMGLVFGDPAMDRELLAVFNYKEDSVLYEDAIVQFYI